MKKRKKNRSLIQVPQSVLPGTSEPEHDDNAPWWVPTHGIRKKLVPRLKEMGIPTASYTQFLSEGSLSAHHMYVLLKGWIYELINVRVDERVVLLSYNKHNWLAKVGVYQVHVDPMNSAFTGARNYPLIYKAPEKLTNLTDLATMSLWEQEAKKYELVERRLIR